MPSSDFPTIVAVKVGRKQHGGTGIFGYSCTVTYSDGSVHRTGFVSSAFIEGDTPWVSVGNVFIDKAVRERCGGRLTPAFIRAFYADQEDEPDTRTCHCGRPSITTAYGDKGCDQWPLCEQDKRSPCEEAGDHLPGQDHRWQECPVYHDEGDED